MPLEGGEHGAAFARLVVVMGTSGYLAAVYLAGDAARRGEAELAAAFRSRALAMGLANGALAVAGLVVLRADARALFDDLTSGVALGAVLASGVAGVATLALVRARRYEPARLSAAIAVAAVVAGWGLAQRPELLPGLTIEEAAAGRPTLVALLVSTAAGAVVLIPSLALLFGLVLRGRFDEGGRASIAAPAAGRPAVARPLVPAALGLLAVGVPLALLGEGVVLGAGVVALVAFVAVGALALLDPTRMTDGEEVSGGRG